MPFYRKAAGRRIPAQPKTSMNQPASLQQGERSDSPTSKTTNQSTIVTSTANNDLPTAPPKDANRVYGPFEQKLQEIILEWQYASFSNFAVDIQIWPVTDAEPDYTGFNFDVHKLFYVSSKSGKIFSGTLVLPIRYWGQYEICLDPISSKINTEDDCRPRTWCSLEKWLSDQLIFSQQAYDFESSEALHTIWKESLKSRIESLAGSQDDEEAVMKCLSGRIARLPNELQWMIYDQLMVDIEYLIDNYRTPIPENQATSSGHLDLNHQYLPSVTVAPRPIKRRPILTGELLQEMLDRYNKNTAFFEDHAYGLDHFRHFILRNWDLSRAFTEYLLESSILEFTNFYPDSKDSFHGIMSTAPMYFLYSIKRLRICWTRCQPGKDMKNWPFLTERYLNAIAAPGHNSIPHWELAALALLPRLKEIEIVFPATPSQYFAEMNFNNPCRRIFVDFILESLFPWITIPGVTVKLTGAVRSSQRNRFANLQTKALAGQPSHKPVITPFTRHALVNAVRESTSSSKNFRNHDPFTNLAYGPKELERKKARRNVEVLSRNIAHSTDRYYMNSETVLRNRRPQQKRKDILALQSIPPLCNCYPPCVVDQRIFLEELEDIDQRRQLFFDDTDEGIAKYLQWMELQQVETTGEDLKSGWN